MEPPAIPLEEASDTSSPLLGWAEDRELSARVVAGDRPAFDVLYPEALSIVWGHASRWRRDRRAAEALTAAILASAFRELMALPPGARFAALLLGALAAHRPDGCEAGEEPPHA